MYDHLKVPKPDMTIGVLAKVAEVNVETVRFYQRKGLMPEPQRVQGSVRRYSEADRSRLQFIKSAQRLGFTLDEIAELLRLEDGSSCAEARAQGEVKLADVRARLDDLKQIETALENLVRLCDATRSKVKCPLIAALKQGAGA